MTACWGHIYQIRILTAAPSGKQQAPFSEPFWEPSPQNPSQNPSQNLLRTLLSGKKKAHKHKQSFPVTARVGGGLPTGWPGVSRPVARGQKFMCYVLCAEPKEHKHFRPGTRPGGSGSRLGGSVTGVTEKLFMCQMFMCLFRLLELAIKLLPWSSFPFFFGGGGGTPCLFLSHRKTPAFPSFPGILERFIWEGSPWFFCGFLAFSEKKKKAKKRWLGLLPFLFLADWNETHNYPEDVFSTN